MREPIIRTNQPAIVQTHLVNDFQTVVATNPMKWETISLKKDNNQVFISYIRHQKKKEKTIIAFESLVEGLVEMPLAMIP